MLAASIDAIMQTAIEHQRTGRLAQAEALYRQVLSAQPNHADATHLLGFLAHQVQRLDDAVSLIRRAIALAPGVPDYYHNLGVVLASAGRLSEALAAFEQAVALRPDNIASRHSLGRVLDALGEGARALEQHRTVVSLAPEFVPGLNELANGAQLAGLPDEAETACRKAISLAPNDAYAWHTLGNALKDQGRIREAIIADRQAVRCDPRNPRSHSSLLYALHLDPEVQPADISGESTLFDFVHARPLEQTPKAYANDRSPNRRLRIGYVSPDFRAHSTSFFTAPLLRFHDRTQVEAIGYSDAAPADSITGKLRGLCDDWRDIHGQSDQAVAEQIASDKIDILVDLALHTAGGRPLLFAKSPSPVQASWLGYPGTTGLAATHYRLTDPYLDPPGVNNEPGFEQPVRLPSTAWCYEPLPEAPEPGPLPMDGAGHVTFGCFNAFSKVNEQVVALWMQVMRSTPGSRLLLLAPPGLARTRFLDRMASAGVSADRIEFVPRRSWQGYMVLYRRVDIVLDTFPWNGHTLGLDALWMGAALVSLSGQTPVSRAGLCYLSNIGLPEFAGSSPAQYVNTAIALASDTPRLRQLRKELRPRMAASPLMDRPAFARAVESAYRMMWRRWTETNCGNANRDSASAR